jgi:hypothetical protein
MEEMGLAKRAGLALGAALRAENSPGPWAWAWYAAAASLRDERRREREVNRLLESQEGCTGAVGLAGENECPEGTPICSQYGCDGPLQALTPAVRRRIIDYRLLIRNV